MSVAKRLAVEEGRDLHLEITGAFSGCQTQAGADEQIPVGLVDVLLWVYSA